jgi:Ser-tRNA(Ala) deacylase AlaX
MHTAEHILNATMTRLFACPRSHNAHIERKKSKCDYLLPRQPTDEELHDVEQRVNEIIDRDLPVSIRFLPRAQAAALVDLSKLPDGVGEEQVRIVAIGDYDLCACIGAHVARTSEIGRFQLLNCDYADGRLRLRFKV